MHRKESVNRRVLRMTAGAVMALTLAFAIGLVFLHTQLLQSHRNQSKALAEGARAIAADYHQRSVRGEMDERTAQDLALAAIRAIRYSGREYVFVFSLDGQTLAFPPRPAWESTNRIDLTDEHGTRIIHSMIALAQSGGGAVSYRFPRFDGAVEEDKTAYVLPFKPWNWLIGTGTYLDDVDAAFFRHAWGFALAGLAMAVLLAVFDLRQGRALARPIEALATATERIRRREYDFDIPAADQDGEIGTLARAIALLRDETRDTEHLRQARELAKKVFDSCREGIAITDSSGHIQSINPAFTAITGYSAEEAVGRKTSILQSQHHDQAFYQTLWQTLQADGRWEGEIWNRRKTGEAYLCHQIIQALADAEGRTMAYVSVQRDLTDARRQEEHIRHLSHHDALTGLPNRILMQDRLQHAIEQARHHRQTVAVTIIDIDRFKVVNDTFGHVTGDELLRIVAGRIVAVMGEGATVARMSGDEFIVLQENISAEAVAQAAGRAIAAVSAPLDLFGHTIGVGASAGIAMFPIDGEEAGVLMKNADAAMYAAKAAGRNTFRFFSSAMTEHAAERLRMEAELRGARDAGQLVLYYQPKVRLDTGAPCGAEALIRWNHPERGQVPPGQFIPLAEESGLIGPISDWVMEEACRQLAEWRQDGQPPLTVAVNVSARQFREGGLCVRLSNLLKRYDLPPSAIEVELTEGTVMSDPRQAISTLGELRDLGVSVAVDDFGTGYSSLAYLKRLPLTVLKIDRAFIIEADSNPEDAQIVRTIMALGQTLGLTIVAEGIETRSQEEFLRGCGCPLGQGYLYSRPLPAADFARWRGQWRAEYGKVGEDRTI